MIDFGYFVICYGECMSQSVSFDVPVNTLFRRSETRQSLALVLTTKATTTRRKQTRMHIEVGGVGCVWLGSVVVRAMDSRSTGRGFDSWSHTAGQTDTGQFVHACIHTSVTNHCNLISAQACTVTVSLARRTGHRGIPLTGSREIRNHTNAFTWSTIFITFTFIVDYALWVTV